MSCSLREVRSRLGADQGGNAAVSYVVFVALALALATATALLHRTIDSAQAAAVPVLANDTP